MALDLGLTTYQLLSALDGLAPNIQSRRRRLDDAIDRALAVPAGGAAFRTAAVGRRPYIAARTGPEGLLGSQPPPQVPQDWTALSVDGSHIDVDRHLPLRCHLVNLGGCAITYGQNHGCQLFSEPTLAVDDDDLYLRAPNGASGKTLIAGPLLGERFRFLVRGAYDSKAGNAHRPTGCRVHARPQLCQWHPVSRRQSGLPAWRLVYFCVLAYYGGVSNSDCRMPTRGQC